MRPGLGESTCHGARSSCQCRAGAHALAWEEAARAGFAAAVLLPSLRVLVEQVARERGFGGRRGSKKCLAISSKRKENGLRRGAPLTPPHTQRSHERRPTLVKPLAQLSSVLVHPRVDGWLHVHEVLVRQQAERQVGAGEEVLPLELRRQLLDELQRAPAPTTTTTTAAPTTTTTTTTTTAAPTTTTIQVEGPRPSVPATPVSGEPSFTG